MRLHLPGLLPTALSAVSMKAIFGALRAAAAAASLACSAAAYLSATASAAAAVSAGPGTDVSGFGSSGLPAGSLTGSW